jgi:hypothetical protein
MRSPRLAPAARSSTHGLALGLVLGLGACAQSSKVPGFENLGGADAGGGGAGASSQGGAGNGSQGGAGNGSQGGAGNGSQGGAGNGSQGGAGNGSQGGAGNGSQGGSAQGGQGGAGNGSQGGSAQGGQGGAGGSACNDLGPGEPNGTEATAVNLGQVTDCDEDGASVTGTLAGPSDADWYRYANEDVFGCSVDPTRAISAAGSIRICKFFECLNGEVPSFDCPGSTTASTSPAGRPGCCGDTGFDLGVECTNLGAGSDNTNVFIRVDSVQGQQCLNYTMDWHY